jgi:rhodanese-related sulfurtransferase
MSPRELRARLLGPNPPTVVDVRGEEAYLGGHVAGARHIPIDDLERRLAEIPQDRPVVTY